MSYADASALCVPRWTVRPFLCPTAHTPRGPRRYARGMSTLDWPTLIWRGIVGLVCAALLIASLVYTYVDGDAAYLLGVPLAVAAGIAALTAD